MREGEAACPPRRPRTAVERVVDKVEVRPSKELAKGLKVEDSPQQLGVLHGGVDDLHLEASLGAVEGGGTHGAQVHLGEVAGDADARDLLLRGAIKSQRALGPVMGSPRALERW